MKSKQGFYTLMLAALLLLLGAELKAQTPNPQNLSNVRVSELSDAQIRAFIRQVESTGLTDAQLEQVAIARGMSPDEVQKLRIRVEQLKKTEALKANSTKKAALPDAPKHNTVRKAPLDPKQDSLDRTEPQTQAEKALLELKAKIFGASLFNNANITFEPNLRLATPANYILGPDDELNIEITGYNEASYSLPVSPEGRIKVEYVGLIPVAGLTVETATARIKSRLAQIYPALASGKTQVSVAIGNIRSIKVTVLGEATKPGSFTLPSLATAFNALYAAGGPTENGSLRQIEIIRNNKIIRTLDVYDFLMRGDQKNNVRLQDQDIIRIPPYKGRVELAGEVKRPAIFEVVPGENLAQVLDFAGGFTENAYTARIKVLQNTSKERRIADVFSADFKNYQPKLGDKFYVEPILERFENRVFIEGAVFRPGDYALSPGLTLKALIQQADGPQEDAFLSRGYITRVKADNTTEVQAFDLAAILNGTAADITLKREDKVRIPSIFDLRDEYKVQIDGAVRQPGEFSYADNMALEDVIIKAGGFSESGSPKRIEVARRVKNTDTNQSATQTAEVFQIDVDPQLRFSKTQFTLKPFDIISVRNAPGFEDQRKVYLKGELTFPGTYVLTRKNERISDLITRAGGLTTEAFVSGASLKRPGAKLNKTNKNNEVELLAQQDKSNQLKRLQGSINDSTQTANTIVSPASLAVGIRLDKILNRPGTSIDLLLEEGDTLTVPRKLQTVKVAGEVLSPISIVYRSGKGLGQYLTEAGGLTEKALVKRTYVVYANGSVKGTRSAFGIKFYPGIKPGAEIFVPQRPEKKKLSAQELLGITSGIASLGAVILGIINLTN